MKVCFLLERGSPPRLNPIFAELFVLLQQRGIEVTVRYPEEELLRLDTLTVDADLYLLKSDTELSLSLATALETMGARVLNRASACAFVKNKVFAAATLLQAGIPTPRSIIAARPEQLTIEAAKAPLILKPYRGYHGAGITVVETPAALPDKAAYPDLVFAQTFLGHTRTDTKVFAIGEELFGVRKAFAPDSYLHAGTPVELSAEVYNLASRCRDVFGLELYGIDVAENDDGPRVVDVNYFPGYRGVPGAARRLADYVTTAVRVT
jgi:ribosomal protein S6--L-glutamate ligase